EDLSRDHEPLDLARSLADLRELRVAEISLDLVLLDVAVAAVDLDPGVRDSRRDLRREELRLGGGQAVLATLVLQPCGTPDELAGGLDLGRHVRDHERHALERPDLAAELLTLTGVCNRRIERRL